MTTNRAAPYARVIQPLAPDHDPRHVEAYMRLQYGTLDHLSAEDFAREIPVCVEAIEQAPDEAEALAVSMGL